MSPHIGFGHRCSFAQPPLPKHVFTHLHIYIFTCACAFTHVQVQFCSTTSSETCAHCIFNFGHYSLQIEHCILHIRHWILFLRHQTFTPTYPIQWVGFQYQYQPALSTLCCICNICNSECCMICNVNSQESSECSLILDLARLITWHHQHFLTSAYIHNSHHQNIPSCLCKSAFLLCILLLITHIWDPCELLIFSHKLCASPPNQLLNHTACFPLHRLILIFTYWKLLLTKCASSIVRVLICKQEPIHDCIGAGEQPIKAIERTRFQQI